MFRNLIDKPRQPRKQIEGAHQCRLGTLLNGVFGPMLSPDLIFWTYSASGERKTLKTAVLQKRKGLQRGDLDYRFEIRTGSIMRVVYIETKTTSGALTPEQKKFIKNHEGIENAKCYTSKSIDESIRILEDEKILLT